MKKLTLLKILVNENDTLHGKNLAEFILKEAHNNGLMGATLWRGVGGYGAHKEIHLGKFPEVSFHLPVAIEIIDSAKKIKNFGAKIQDLLSQNGLNGFMLSYEVFVWDLPKKLKI